MARVREQRADIAPHDSATRLASLGVDVFFGNATFSGPRSVAVDGGALHFKRAVIATGSRPAIPEAFGTTGIYTSENIFELTEQPRQMLVAGGGPVGCELAQAFALLGTRVTLVEQSGRILPGDDPDAAAILAKVLVEDGVSLETGVRADPQRAPGAVLVAAGRLPNIEGLGLDAAGVAAGAAGITVDDQLRTTNRRVFAAGDVCSRFKFTHAADAMARIVVQNALFFGRRRASALVIPSCTYTLPEIARVGSVAGPHVTIRLDDVDRAIVDDAREGFVRIHHEDGRITGATIVAPHAGELIGYVASAMRHGHSLDAFSSDVFPYPTLAEALRKAGDTYRRGRLTRPVRRLLGGYFGMRKLWP
jgi:pyruvate/2-oxoglutarate dehydrogenase complex dihydrolipoamide dehydrogenase (E3) component